MEKLIVANFKLNKTIAESIDYAKKLRPLLKKCKNKVVVCPSFISIESMVNSLKGSNIEIGAQDCAFAENGAYTGEVSAKMLAYAGVKYVILGHSERREYFNETCLTINEKILQAQKYNLIPIVCISDDGGAGYKKNIKKELMLMLAGIEKECYIAFEPKSAIGTGNEMELKKVQSIVRLIKSESESILGSELKVLYGGSITKQLSSEYLACETIDGLLIGGACLNVDDFAQIATNSNIDKA